MASFPFSTTDFPIFLAPMEEVSDSSFRRLCKSYGADVVISEFVSSEAIVNGALNDKKKRGAKITVAIVNEIGKCELKTIEPTELKGYL